MTPKIIPFSHPFLIQAPLGDTLFANTAQALVDTVIPETLWSSAPQESETIFYRLKAMLPLFHCSELDDSSESIAFTYLCPAESSSKAKRYVTDALIKQLIPDKQAEIVGGINLSFQFVQDASHRFFIAQEIVAVKNSEERGAIKRNLPEVLAQLKEKFSSEFLGPKENTVHPVFMPRNEEETIRNLILLSSQIKYVRDLPQVSIHYDKQTDSDLSFTVIIARLLHGKFEPLRKLLEKSSLKMGIDDMRVMGYLKQKYPKEAAVLHFSVDKKTFFRPNHSVDLLKARQKIVSELTLCLGEFRDFNGGMILKQDEALCLLRKELGKQSRQKEFLLEEYFYSLKPGIMQTVHDTLVLKRHYEMLNEILIPSPPRTVIESVGKFLLCYITSHSPIFKEKVLTAIASLQLSSRDLTTSLLEIDDITTMGFILRAESPEMAQKFENLVRDL
jgi:hypothetical protein